MLLIRNSYSEYGENGEGAPASRRSLFAPNGGLRASPPAPAVPRVPLPLKIFFKKLLTKLYDCAIVLTA